METKPAPRPLSDPFDGQFDAAKRALTEILNRPFTGHLAEAMRIGNTAVLAFRLLSGDYDANEISFKITTTKQE